MSHGSPEAIASGGAAVRTMFDAISPRYDLANRLMSFGVDPAWRRAAVRALAPAPGARVLDVATGTGDLALALAKAVGPTGRVVGCDFSPAMLARAPAKAAALARRTPIASLAWCRADGLALPFADRAFDLATIAFGIRNTADPARCARELFRVVRPGGAVAVLEFGQPTNPLFAPMYRAYSRFAIPLIGGLVTGVPSAYRYLPRTAAAFPSGPAFAALMGDAGFADVVVQPLTFGIAWLYVGRVR